MTIQTMCPDCGAIPGLPHHDDCDIQRCSVCGTQRLTCGCEGHEPLRSIWTGDLPKKKNVELSLKLSKDKRIGAKRKQCYYNAFKTLYYCHEYAHATYVEGIAVVGTLSLEHGWIEFNDEIIDPTLPTDTFVYFPGLRCEGPLGISMALRRSKPSYCDDLPFFYRFGWGGCDCPEFAAARQAAERFVGQFVEQQSLN